MRIAGEKYKKKGITIHLSTYKVLEAIRWILHNAILGLFIGFVLKYLISYNQRIETLRNQHSANNATLENTNNNLNEINAIVSFNKIYDSINPTAEKPVSKNTRQLNK